MAQLNPNFEIDFSDINSYEQIQLINDTQLAKENLLMHRAYKEPSDDEIIRNQFSSFTFVDFCPKLYSVKSSTTNQASAQQLHESAVAAASKLESGQQSRGVSLRFYELETFSDLFERINTWLKLNKDWRVVSMETLVYDCTSQFNHHKSSIHSNYLPQNTRGLRLFLSPSKSRFSGPQKIGCINVVPRKVSGSYTNPRKDPPTYETLDEILNRLNELLLTRPIEGRILSVETLTLPMFNGYVNTETNYFIDNRLNTLYESTYVVATSPDCSSSPMGHSEHGSATQQTASSGDNNIKQEQSLIDILRVYYEFGPMVCGLVNLIDFVPKFYSSKPPTNNPPETSDSGASLSTTSTSEQQQDGDSSLMTTKPVPKIAATESLTRLIRRSLAWFESERKRILNEKIIDTDDDPSVEQTVTHHSSSKNKVIDLKVCNLQVHHKTLLKSHLLEVNPQNVIDTANTRIMLHKRMDHKPPVICGQCSLNSAETQLQDWCSHLIELTQPYQLKFVRLAYIVPVFNDSILRPAHPLRLHRSSDSYINRKRAATVAETFCESRTSSAASNRSGQLIPPDLLISDSSNSSSDQEQTTPPNGEPQEPSSSPPSAASGSLPEGNDTEDGIYEKAQVKLMEANEENSKQVASIILRDTNNRHKVDELAHQLQQTDDGLNDSPIGQLTYRLFAPCQLVSSSSCFSINPVNSSSPLARRGSVDINGSGISSENAHPSTSLLAPGSTNSLASSGESQQVITSFGAFFPALSHEIMAANSSMDSGNFSTLNTSGSRLGSGVGGGAAAATSNSSSSTSSNRFTTNEFEPVDAIKRRMEVYVTTNSMKVIAGETLIVHLSDALSCLSTAIEQTVIKANLGTKQCRSSSTWVSVYVLYAAVEEPQLPVQLLAQQKMRELSLIDEGSGFEDEEEEMDSLSTNRRTRGKVNCDEFQRFNSSPLKKEANKSSDDSVQPPAVAAPAIVSESLSSIRVEQNPINSSLTLYNSAYDRTVALPTPPENHSSASVDPADYLGSDGVWLCEEDPFSDRVLHLPDLEARKKRRKKAKKRRNNSNKHDDSQCSIM